MSVKYKVVEIGNPQDQAAPKKFYARVVKSGDTSLHALSKEIAGRSSLMVGDVKKIRPNRSLRPVRSVGLFNSQVLFFKRKP